MLKTFGCACYPLIHKQFIKSTIEFVSHVPLVVSTNHPNSTKLGRIPKFPRNYKDFMWLNAETNHVLYLPKTFLLNICPGGNEGRN